MRRLRAALFVLGMTALPSDAQEPSPYAPEIDAKPAHAQALARAEAEGRHLWVQIGEPSCPVCERLHWFIEAHPETSEALRRDFIPLHPAISRQNIPLFRQWGSPQLEHGVPVILILDAKGEILTLSPVKAFAAEGGEFSEALIAKFMRFWSPEAVKRRAAEPSK